jgi:RHH-type proline utilization regulon transcriptional repressor/proline dehydrogenase/delta 1-pyrroline-5-carboxylate dehydrogenase
MPPTIVELASARELKQEVFGPVLHVVRWRADDLESLLDDVAANGYALTLGIASRVDTVVDRIADRLPH